MTPRTLVILGLMAVTGAAGAAWQWQANRSGFIEAERGERVLPSLLGRANEVAAIFVQQGERSFRLVRGEDASYRLEGSGVPVKAGRFPSAVVAAASLEKFEAKTAREDLYSKIEVGNPGDADAASRLMRFETADGTVIAELILGKKARGRVGGTIADGQYVRVPGEAQSWLTRGVVEGTAQLSSWVDAGVVEMNTSKVVKATFQPAGGPELVVRRTGVTEGGHPKFELDGLPEGRTPKNDLTIRYAATDIANSQFVDVRKDQGGDVAWHATLMMEDGMLIGFDVTADDWISVKVLDEGRDKETSGDIINRTGGYQYQLPDFKIRQFKQTMENLTEPAS